MHHDKVADVYVGTVLTTSTCHALRTTVRTAFVGHDAVRLWLDSVELVDAPGLGLLVGLQRHAERLDASLVCVNPSARLMTVLRQVGLDRALHLQISVATAAEIA